MKPTRPSACFCRRTAACFATTASCCAMTARWRETSATIASAMVTAITHTASAVIAVMRRMRRCCSRCFNASKPTSSMPAINLSLAFGGRLPVRIELETQRGAEALFRFAAGDVEGIRFATDDQAEDAVASAHALPSQHFLVDPARRGRRRRADHDQVFRLRECCVDLLGQAVGAGEFVAIAEDRIQAARDRAVRSLFADQPRWHAIGFQRLVQPVRPRLVAVAVADERTIGEAGDRRLGHATPPALDAATHRPWLGTIVGRAGRWRVATIPYGRIAGPKLAPNVNRV